MEYFEKKALCTTTPHLECGIGMWMTHLSSKRKITNKTSLNTLIVLTSHKYQYLQWDSHHHLSAKYSVINTLTHRAKTVCNKPDLLQKEMDHPRKVLTHCKYPKWAIDRVERRLSKPTSEESNGASTQVTADAKPTTNNVKTKGHIIIPIHPGSI